MLHHMLRAAAGNRGEWTPNLLFDSGETGAWYEFRPEYLALNPDGTGAVTADGDLVGWVQDLSGNGNHLTQSYEFYKPRYKTDGVYHWIIFDTENDEITGDVVGTAPTSYLTQIIAYKAASSAASEPNPGPYISWPTTSAGASSKGLTSSGSSGGISGEKWAIYYQSNSVSAGRLGTTNYNLTAETPAVVSQRFHADGYKLYKDSTEITVDLSDNMTTSSDASPADTGISANTWVIRANTIVTSYYGILILHDDRAEAEYSDAESYLSGLTP